jgi:hypothetical protein
MKVLILEACRSPEVDKGLTEPLVLSQLFSNSGIEYELYSNDGIWTNQVQIDEVLIRNCLQASSIDVVHFAVHGTAQGLILKWSDAPSIKERMPLSFLTGSQIRLMQELQGKLIVSGACASAQFADDFLAAGAKAVVAPLTDVLWSKIGLFFKAFYLSYRLSESAQDALNEAVVEFPQYGCYRVFEN